MEKWAKLSFNGENFNVETDSGNLKVGENALSPMGLLLVALGGCTGVDVISMLKKMNKTFDLKVEVSGKRVEEHPRVYREIHLKYYITGDVEEREAKRVVSLSLSRYCSVSAMLSKSCPIFYSIYLNGREVESGKKG